MGVANANVYAVRRDRRAMEGHKKAYKDVLGGDVVGLCWGSCELKTGKELAS